MTRLVQFSIEISVQPNRRVKSILQTNSLSLQFHYLESFLCNSILCTKRTLTRHHNFPQTTHSISPVTLSHTADHNFRQQDADDGDVGDYGLGSLSPTDDIRTPPRRSLHLSSDHYRHHYARDRPLAVDHCSKIYSLFFLLTWFHDFLFFMLL